MKKEERLKSAFDYLRSQGRVHTQKDVANLMGASESTVSKALKGEPIQLTDNFLERFNSTFGNVFNIDWLKIGEGEMLRSQSINGDNNVQVGGNANNVNAGGAIEKALDQIAKAHELLAKMHEDADSRLAKSQEEIDHLISIIENMQNNGKCE